MIPRNEIEREFLERIQKLERKSFNGETFETNYGKLSPRQQAERITSGEDPNHHIGKKSIEVLKQEGFSLRNSFKPQTMTEQAQQDWYKKHADWVGEVTAIVGYEKEFGNLLVQIDRMLDPQ